MKDLMKLIKGQAQLNEVLVNLNKSGRDDRYGNWVIMVGGAGSGKSLYAQNMLSVSGASKILDTDELKKMSLRLDTYRKKLEDIFGKSIEEIQQDQSFFKNPDNVFKMHAFVKEVGIKDKKEQALYSSILVSRPEIKPNVIMDITGKSLNSVYELLRAGINLGYDKKKIHLIWILQDVDIAVQANQMRDRQVPNNILVQTHVGAADTMYLLFHPESQLQKDMDGSVYLIFNRFKISKDATFDPDSIIKTSDRGGMYIKKAQYVNLKQPGKKPVHFKEIDSKIIDKVKEYIPDDTKFKS